MANFLSGPTEVISSTVGYLTHVAACLELRGFASLDVEAGAFLHDPNAGFPTSLAFTAGSWCGAQGVKPFLHRGCIWAVHPSLWDRFVSSGGDPLVRLAEALDDVPLLPVALPHGAHDVDSLYDALLSAPQVRPLAAWLSEHGMDGDVMGGGTRDALLDLMRYVREGEGGYGVWAEGVRIDLPWLSDKEFAELVPLARATAGDVFPVWTLCLPDEPSADNERQ